MKSGNTLLNIFLNIYNIWLFVSLTIFFYHGRIVSEYFVRKIEEFYFCLSISSYFDVCAGWRVIDFTTHFCRFEICKLQFKDFIMKMRFDLIFFFFFDVKMRFIWSWILQFLSDFSRNSRSQSSRLRKAQGWPCVAYLTTVLRNNVLALVS